MAKQQLPASLAHLQRYIDYLHNVGQAIFETKDFDEDWEPVGPMVRAEMERAGLIEQDQGGMALAVNKPSNEEHSS